MAPSAKASIKLAQPLRAGRVVFLQVLGIDEHLHAQILIDLVFAFCLGQPPHGVQVVGLDPVEVVFGLRVDHAKHGIRIGLAINMRDAPVIAHNLDVGRLRGPTRSLR